MAQEYPVTVEWKPFELRPDTPPEGIVRNDGRGPELTEPLKSAALAAGLTRMKRSPVIASTRTAHEAAEYAKEVGRHDPFHRATFSAYFDEGLNIGRPEVLRDIALAAGLDWSTLESRLASGHYSREVNRQLVEGHQIGITGVPAYIIGRYLVVGAQPYQVFQQVMERIARDRAEAGDR